MVIGTERKPQAKIAQDIVCVSVVYCHVRRHLLCSSEQPYPESTTQTRVSFQGLYIKLKKKKKKRCFVSRQRKRGARGFDLERLGRVGVGVVVQDDVVGHVEALPHAQVVEQRRLAEDIAHVHHGDVCADKKTFCNL